MKKTAMTVFLCICFALCLVPAVWMAVSPSMERIGNERVVNLPAWKDEEEHWNLNLLSQLGDYFEQHYAFRPQLITADAALQTSLFQVSNTDSVITGKDGWLFYRSTLEDYLGKNVLSERGIYNLAHNLSLLQQYVRSQNAEFLFLVPPNKNTLYPEYMPYYYSCPENILRNRDLIKPALSEQGIHYSDLFALFQGTGEILYLKEDSHWNNKGALLVYNQILTDLGKEHPDYKEVSASLEPAKTGDLRAMIYPADERKEPDYLYSIPMNFEYISNPASSDPVSVEDFRIESVCEEAEGSLLMYRDSFANSLLPLLANTYEHGYYSKAVPYTVAKDMKQYQPDTVLVELVERNLKNLAQMPAVFPSPQADPDSLTLTPVEGTKNPAAVCMADMTYMELSGTVSEEFLPNQENIYLSISVPDQGELLYEAFTVSDADTDGGYVLYLPADLFSGPEEANQLEYHIYVGN